MRRVRTALLFAWIILIASLVYDPVTPLLTAPDASGPFHVGRTPAIIQGAPYFSEPYAMGNRIFWSMAVPLLPMLLMLFGHETWRRICPLSHFSQIPRMLGWERRPRVLNRKSGNVDRVLALLPSQSWLRRNHFYVQFALLSLGVLGRTLFYNSDRTALFVAFVVILLAALLVGLAYGGKTWCNYFCPTAVIQEAYSGPGGLFDSKPHLERTALKRSACRDPTQSGDRSICVGCRTNCPDIDLENAYWKTIDSDQKRDVYFGLFGLILAFNTYFYIYAGDWSYYMSGYWTHESGQLAALLKPGLFIEGQALPLPKIVAAPLYFIICIAAIYGLFRLAERLYSMIALARRVDRPVIRHHVLSVSAFLSFNLFYVFAGRSNILLLPTWGVRMVDLAITFVSVTWLIRTLARTPDLYQHENLGYALRQELIRIGFRSEDVLDGRSIAQLSADEVYVLAKTLPNFTAAQKRDAYRTILSEALGAGQTKFSESLKLLRDLRVQLGLSEADHEAIAQALGVQDASILDSDATRTVETRARRDSYRDFLLGLIQKGLAAGVPPSKYLDSADGRRAIGPLRRLFNISGEDHAAVVADITNDDVRLLGQADALAQSLRDMECARFVLQRTRQPEALLIAHALGERQINLIREIVRLLAPVEDIPTAAQRLRAIEPVVGSDAGVVLSEEIAGGPHALRTAYETTDSRIAASYIDIIRRAASPLVEFRRLASDHDPLMRAIATSGLSLIEPVEGAKTADALLAAQNDLPATCRDILAPVRNGERSRIVAVMAELLVAPTFARADLSMLANISRQAWTKVLGRGEAICRQGEGSDAMFVLLKGETVAWVDSPSGRIELGRASAGAVFGELGVITGRTRSATIEVVSPFAKVVAIPRAAVDDLLIRDASVARGMLRVVSGYLIENMAAAAQRTSGTGATAEAAEAQTADVV